jgi:hypothetical protein
MRPIEELELLSFCVKDLAIHWLLIEISIAKHAVHRKYACVRIRSRSCLVQDSNPCGLKYSAPSIKNIKFPDARRQACSIGGSNADLLELRVAARAVKIPGLESEEQCTLQQLHRM